MSLSRNDPCHCGSGKKYKKCCLAQDETLAAQASVLDVASAGCSEFHDTACPYCDGLRELDDHAAALIKAERWDEAREVCSQLKDCFPDEIYGDYRFFSYYSAQAQFGEARPHARAALEHARATPEKYPRKVIELLSSLLTELNAMIEQKTSLSEYQAALASVGP